MRHDTQVTELDDEVKRFPSHGLPCHKYGKGMAGASVYVTYEPYDHFYLAVYRITRVL
jgi:hypothetical protein